MCVLYVLGVPQWNSGDASCCRGVSFQGTTIGLAPLKAMCSDYQSGGVNAVSSASCDSITLRSPDHRSNRKKSHVLPPGGV